MVQPPGCLAWAFSTVCFNSLLHDILHDCTAYTCLCTPHSLPTGYQSLEGNVWDSTIIYPQGLAECLIYRNSSFTKWKNGNLTIIKWSISEWCLTGQYFTFFFIDDRQLHFTFNPHPAGIGWFVSHLLWHITAQDSVPQVPGVKLDYICGPEKLLHCSVPEFPHL